MIGIIFSQNHFLNYCTGKCFTLITELTMGVVSGPSPRGEGLG